VSKSPEVRRSRAERVAGVELSGRHPSSSPCPYPGQGRAGGQGHRGRAVSITTRLGPLPGAQPSFAGRPGGEAAREVIKDFKSEQVFFSAATEFLLFNCPVLNTGEDANPRTGIDRNLVETGSEPGVSYQVGKCRLWARTNAGRRAWSGYEVAPLIKKLIGLLYPLMPGSRAKTSTVRPRRTRRECFKGEIG
jgi:hypothetical protein